jgi:hypothetical protein
MQLRASPTYLDHNKARERERKARGGGDDADESSAEESDGDDVQEGDRDEFEAKKKKLADVKPEAKALTVRPGRARFMTRLFTVGRHRSA